MFDGANAPLGTFSARIELAYRIGEINATLARALHLIRKIRNDFAHNVSGCSFGDGVVTSRLTELRRCTRVVEIGAKFRPYPVGARGDFQFIVSWIQWMIHSRIERTVSIETSGALIGELPSDSIDESSSLPATVTPTDN